MVEESKNECVVGIDLGTTNSCVAAIWPGSNGVTVVRNDLGWNTTPSWVSFGPEVITVGVPART